MIIVKNENVAFYDVDGTLVVHQLPQTIPAGEAAEVYDSVTKKFITVRINKPMVRLLKESKHRGDYVIVWSRGGYQWAANVIKALGLVDNVDQVMSKPMAYFDDSDISTWLPYRVFLPPETVYKRIKSE